MTEYIYPDYYKVYNGSEVLARKAGVKFLWRDWERLGDSHAVSSHLQDGAECGKC